MRETAFLAADYIVYNDDSCKENVCRDRYFGNTEQRRIKSLVDCDADDGFQKMIRVVILADSYYHVHITIFILTRNPFSLAGNGCNKNDFVIKNRERLRVKNVWWLFKLSPNNRVYNYIVVSNTLATLAEIILMYLHGQWKVSHRVYCS